MIIKNENMLYAMEEKDYIESDDPSVPLFLELKKRIIDDAEPQGKVIKSLTKKIGFYTAYNKFLRYYTQDEEKPLTEAIKPQRKGKSRTVQEMDSYGKIDFIHDPLLPEGSITLLCGDAGIGKSYISLFLGFIISEGMDFLGSKTKKKNVLFVDLESSLPLLNTRIQSINIKSENIFFYTEPLNFLLKEDIAELKNEILYREAGFCVIDSLMDIIPGINENDAGAMNQIFSALRSLVKQTGCSFLIIHHVNKANGDYRGSSAIKGAIDALYTLKSVKEKSTYKILEIEPTKTRYTMIHPIKLKIEWEKEKFYLFSYTEAEENMDKAIEAEEKYSDIMSILMEHQALVAEDLIQKIKEQSIGSKPLSNSSIYRKLKNMTDKGLLNKSPAEGRKNLYSLMKNKK